MSSGWFETTVRGGFPVEAYVDLNTDEAALYPSASVKRNKRLSCRLKFLEARMTEADWFRLFEAATEALADPYVQGD